MTLLIAVGVLVLLVWASIVMLALLCIIKYLEDMEGCKEMVDAFEAFERDAAGGDWWVSTEDWEWKEPEE
jgi:hypothetical protein